MINVLSCRVESGCDSRIVGSPVWCSSVRDYGRGCQICCAAIKTNCFLWIVFAGCLMQSFAETALCTILGTNSSREYSFQNRHAPLYLTCVTPCEAQRQR